MEVSQFGEAVVLELGGKGTVFVLPEVHFDDGLNTAGIWANQVIYAIGVQGATTRQHLPIIKALEGRFKFFPMVKGANLPLMVAFGSESEFRSVYRVLPHDFSKHFGGGVKFVGVEFEITDEPITDVLKQRLPILTQIAPAAPDEEVRKPDGKLIPFADKPFKYKIGTKSFFAPGRF
jgi:hypothetical protein